MCLAGLPAAASGAAGPEPDREPWIAVFAGGLEPDLRDSSVPIWDREEGVVVTGPSEAQLDVLRAQGVEPVFSVRDHGEGLYILSHDRQFTPPALGGLLRFRINGRAMLYLIPAGMEVSLPRLKLHALFHGVPRVALPAVRVHPADAAAAAPLAASADPTRWCERSSTPPARRPGSRTSGTCPATAT